jgi:shikimate kinase
MKRPLLTAQKDLMQYIRETLEIRETIYNKASQVITITINDKIHEVCQRILQTIPFKEERTKI